MSRITSSGYSFTIGLVVKSPLLVRSLAARVSPSFPVISSSITASFHRVLGESSCTWTTSPTLMVCELSPVFLCWSRSAVRYSVFHLLQNWPMMCSCLFARLVIDSWPELALLHSVSIAESMRGNDVILRPYRRCAGVNGSGSSMLGDKCVNGRSFITASISVTTVCSDSMSM